MNVLYLINYAGKAGTEKYVENLVRILGKELIDPFLCYGVAGELSEKLARSSVPCYQIDLGWKNARSAAKKLAEYCRENKIDVIHAQYPRENIIALMSKKYYAAPRVILTNHLTLRLSGIKGFVWKAINRHFTPKNHCIIAVCQEGRDIMLENGVDPDKIKVIFNGVEPEQSITRSDAIRRELGLEPEVFILTILARFAPEKGLDFLVDALESVRIKTQKPFCCLICGDGELMPEIKQRISSQELEAQFRLLGFRSDCGEILHGSDLYLCSSRCNEAMSFAILEAMNAGLPLVVTDVGGNAQLAVTDMDCGFVADFGDVNAFSDAIVSIMEDDELRLRLSTAANEKVKQFFNLTTLAHDVYETYQ